MYGFLQTALDGLLFILGSPAEDISHHFFTIARMTNPYAQTQKVIASQMSDDIAQTVMTTVSTRPLKANRARWQIEFIMGYQDGMKGNLIKIHQAGYRLATAIHKGHRL